MEKKFEIVTNTASLAIFDPQAISHRIHDSVDWWSDYFEEIEEINAGNIIIVGLGVDGKYKVSIRKEPIEKKDTVCAFIRCISGNIFIGPGEDISGGDMEPKDRLTTGTFVEVKPATYKIFVSKILYNHISISLVQVKGDATNSIDKQLLFE